MPNPAAKGNVNTIAAKNISINAKNSVLIGHKIILTNNGIKHIKLFLKLSLTKRQQPQLSVTTPTIATMPQKLCTIRSASLKLIISPMIFYY